MENVTMLQIVKIKVMKTLVILFVQKESSFVVTALPDFQEVAVS
jgi:hypothetical protein